MRRSGGWGGVVVAVAMALGLSAASVQAAAEETGTAQGLVILGGGGSAGIVHPVQDVDTSNVLYSVTGFVGYFVSDEVALGVAPTLAGDFGGDVVQIGASGQAAYHFTPRNVFTPFATAGVGVLHTEVDSGSVSGSDTDTAFTVGGGFRYFLVRNASVDFAVRYAAPFDEADAGVMAYLLGFSVYLGR